MSSYFQKYLFTNSGERLTKEFSYNEVSNCYGHFRHQFKEQLLKPCADNNYLINYDLQFRNFLLFNGTIQMVVSGVGTYTFKTIFGNAVDKHSLNYLGERKGYFLQVILYVGMFFYGQSVLSKQKTIDINHLINPREKNGEIMMQIILRNYPHKVDHKKLREVLLQKNEYNLMKVNQFEQQIQRPKILMKDEKAIQDYFSNYNQSHQQVQQPPKTEEQLVNNAPNIQEFLHREQMTRLINSQPKEEAASASNVIEVDASKESLEKMRLKTIDQIRQANRESPYLNTNTKLLVDQGPHLSPVQNAPQVHNNSPYYSPTVVGQQDGVVHGNQFGSGNKPMPNSPYGHMMNGQQGDLRSQTGYGYSGVYSNIAKQARNDSS